MKKLWTERAADKMLKFLQETPRAELLQVVAEDNFNWAADFGFECTEKIMLSTNL